MSETQQVEPEMTIDAALHRIANGPAMLDCLAWNDIRNADETLWLALRTIVEFTASQRGVSLSRPPVSP